MSVVPPAVHGQPRPFRSLATKFLLFTAALLFWVVLTLFAFDFQENGFAWQKWGVVSVVVAVVAAAVSRFTITLLARPLTLLEQGIQAVTGGRLERVQVSPTGDEIESLGHSFNEMIEKLIATEREVRHQQDVLADKVRQRTEELEREVKKTQAASQARAETVAGLSHQLRTTMNGLQGMIDLAQQGVVNAEQREHLESAMKCAGSLQSMLDSILDLSEIEAGRITLDQSVFEIRPLFEETVDTYKAAAAAKGVALSLEIGPGVPVRMKADRRRIRQIIGHLVSNAVKFTSQGWVKVRVQQEPARGGPLLVTEIIDTGTGIGADRIPGLFNASGTVGAFGLPVTRTLVELHGGQLSVQSQPTVGTTFRCALPCPVVDDVPIQLEALAAAAQRTPPILVVEDNHINQKVVTGMLRKRGYRVDIANHGREALERLESHTYGLILMDVQMPVLDGFETTRLIKADPRLNAIPVVAMTALALPGDRERCLEAGMDAYVSKPLNTATLLRVVEEQLVQ